MYYNIITNFTIVDTTVDTMYITTYVFERMMYGTIIYRATGVHPAHTIGIYY
jgi:hypothetical protein